MRLADELPDNPFADLVDAVVDEANRRGDTSNEGISKVVTEAFQQTARGIEPPEDLFEERESLRRIRDFARQRMVAPGAVLLGVLQRAETAAPQHVMIPPMIGSPKPLNTVVVNVGPSGHGKTASDDTAEEYWPADLPVFPLGTAEGMCQAFDPDEDGQPQVPNIIFSSSEIDNWAALGERAGSMIFPVMRQVVTGDTIGQKNATKGHTRIVAKRTYGCGINLSAQPGSNGAAVLFRDAPGGFPQRCVFGSVLDPDAPDEPPTGIEPYRPAQEPDFAPNAGPYYEIPFPESVVAEIRAHQRGVLRGEPGLNPLDGHRNLCKAKVAAGLMLLEGRNSVTEDDWRIAERIMTVSDRVRADLIRATEDTARTANRARALAAADRDEVVATTKLQRAKNTIIKHLAVKGELPRHELRKRLRSDQREHFDAAVAELEDQGRLFADESGTSTVYRISSDSDGQSTWTESPRPKPQVNDRGPKVHVDAEHNVTNIDSRRSSEIHRPTLSAPKWLENHLATLRAEGNDTTESFAVIEAGQAAGYTADALRTAASKSPMVRVIGRGPRTSIWDITGGNAVYKPAVAWVDEYIDSLPENTTEIDRDAFREAAEAARYTWTAARHAALNHPRVRSEPAEGDSTVKRIWALRPINTTTEGETA